MQVEAVSADGADHDEATQENEPLEASESREHGRHVGKRVSLERVDRQRKKRAKQHARPHHRRATVSLEEAASLGNDDVDGRRKSREQTPDEPVGRDVKRADIALGRDEEGRQQREEQANRLPDTRCPAQGHAHVEHDERAGQHLKHRCGPRIGDLHGLRVAELVGVERKPKGEKGTDGAPA